MYKHIGTKESLRSLFAIGYDLQKKGDGDGGEKTLSLYGAAIVRSAKEIARNIGIPERDIEEMTENGKEASRDGRVVSLPALARRGT